MKIQTTSKDLAPKLKSFIKGYFSLRESGIPNIQIDLDPLLNDFLTQFEEPVPETPSVPLPPPNINGPSAYAFIARNKDTGVSIEKTLSSGQWACSIALNDQIPNYARHNYEIIGLYAND